MADGKCSVGNIVPKEHQDDKKKGRDMARQAKRNTVITVLASAGA